MIVTGNVQVDGKHLTLGRDMVIPVPQALKVGDTNDKGKNKERVVHDTVVEVDEYEEHVRHFQRLAATMKDDFAGKKMSEAMQAATDVTTGTLKGTTFEEMERKRSKVIMQLNHSGRQSPFLIGGRRPFKKPIGPSAVGVGRGKRAKRQGWFAAIVNRVMFQTPREMTMMDLEEVVEQFVRGAKVAVEAGFDGVQLHASHGCEYSFAWLLLFSGKTLLIDLGMFGCTLQICLHNSCRRRYVASSLSSGRAIVQYLVLLV